MIKLASWNIKRLNTSHKQREIKKIIRGHHLSLLCIVENKVNGSNINRVKSKCLLNWNMVHNWMGGC